jgi:hypothetical protein
MNFLKRLFAKQEKPPFFFEFQTCIISEPNFWSPEVQEVVDELTETERRKIIIITTLLQESIEWHSRYILNTRYTSNKLKDHPEYVFKSFFELTSLNWVLVTDYFRENEVRSEVGQALWWVIKYSFDGLDDILFKAPSLNSFENAFRVGQETYSELLTQYFKPRVNETKKYADLFDKIVDDPLADSGGLDFLKSFSMNFDKMPDIMLFHKHFSEGMNKFTNKLYQIKF